MKKICLLGVLCILAGAATAQDPSTKSHTAPWGTPTIDGDLSEWPDEAFADTSTWGSQWGSEAADPIPGAPDFDARWAAMHDADNIYVVIEVQDDVRETGDQVWENDCVDFFFEATNENSTAVRSGMQITIKWNGTEWEYGDPTTQDANDSTYDAVVVDDGDQYVIELSIGKDQLDSPIPAGADTIGFDIKPNDTDVNGQPRQLHMFWGSENTANEDYNNASSWANLVLAPEPVELSTIEQDGDVASIQVQGALTDNTITLEHVLGAASGEDRIVVILVQTETVADPVGTEPDIPITSVTYNGVAATQVMDASSNPGELQYRMQTDIYYINDVDLPAAAGTYNVAVVYAEPSVGDAAVAAVAFTGVSQTGPAAAGEDSMNGVTGNAATSSISLEAFVDGSIALDIVGGNQNDTSLTIGADQTEIFLEGGASAKAAGSTEDVATAGSVTMSWELGTNVGRYAHSAILLKPAGGTAAIPTIKSNISAQFVSVGDNVVLTAPAGSGYVWYKNGVVIDGETDATLELDNIQVEDSGTFKVSYTGDSGAATTPNLWIPVKAAGEVPVSGLIGLAALMGACGIGGASMLRRRK